MALRLAQWQRLAQATTCLPLLSLDDFEAHLDLSRVEALLLELGNRGQSFLTTPKKEPSPLFTVFSIHEGTILVNSI